MEINIFFILITLLFSAFFSGVEIAFVSSLRQQTEKEKKPGHSKSDIPPLLFKNSKHFIVTLIVGNIFSLVAFGFLFVNLSTSFILLNITQSKLGSIIIQIFFSALIILIIRELLSKTLFSINSSKAFHFFAIPAFVFYFLLYPVAHLAIILSSFLLKQIFKLKIDEKEEKIAFGAIDIETIEDHNNGETETDTEMEHDIKLFQNALDFSNVKLRECTIPRNEIAAIEITSPVEKLKEKFIETGYSKILIYKETIDHIIGYAQSSDLFQEPQNISSMLKNLIIAPETMAANKLLNLFMKEHKSIALIVDEFGGTAGIVTIEDIMEEIFGEIEDEHDSTDFKEEKLSNNEYVFSGRLEIDYLNEKFNLDIPESDEYETIAGYILHHHQEIPNENDKLSIAHFDFEILKMHNPKIELIKIKINP